jgi:hypothetical protein
VIAYAKAVWLMIVATPPRKVSKSMVDSKRERFTLAEARKIGDKLGVDWEKFDVKQFCTGMNAELADGMYNPVTSFASDDPILVGKAVRTHLNEFPDYYTQWAQMEKEAAHDPNGKHTITQVEKMARGK